MRTIRDNGEGKGWNFWWGEVAPSQGFAFPLQTQHSGNGIRAEETGKRGEARGDQTRLQHRAEQRKSPQTHSDILRHTPTWHNMPSTP